MTAPARPRPTPPPGDRTPHPVVRPLILLLALIALAPAVVGWQGAAVSAPMPVVARALADLTSRTILIEGADFGADPPVVALDHADLTVLAAAPGRIVTNLPARIRPGRYVLTISVGPAYVVRVRVLVTIGQAD